MPIEKDVTSKLATISAHVLNEFVAVARRKLEMFWADVTEALDAIRILCPSPIPIAVETHDTADTFSP